MAEFRIEPEFRDLLPKLSDDEREKLMVQINADGCRDPLVIWQEEGVLIDGHSRLAICQELEIPYSTVSLSFKTADDAKMWMFRNQLGRRNLSTFQRAEIALRMKPTVEALAKARRARGTGCKEGEAITTREVIGHAAGVSGRTIDKVSAVLKHANSDLIEQLRSGDVSISSAAKSVTSKQPRTDEYPRPITKHDESDLKPLKELIATLSESELSGAAKFAKWALRQQKIKTIHDGCCDVVMGN